MSRGKVYIRSGTDHIVIPNIRTAIRQKFAAGTWTDLRIGFFLSITAAANDDDPTGLAETISSVRSPYDCYWLGLKSEGDPFPYAGASSFVGFTNAIGLHPPDWRDLGDSKLISSDVGVGTTNAYFWRSIGGVATPAWPGGFCGFLALNYTNNQSALSNGWEQHFSQDPTNSGGYSIAFGLRLTRPSPTSHLFTAEVNSNDSHSCDLAFSDTPTREVLFSLLEGWPTSVRTSPQFFLDVIPTSFFFYWPFHSSRLRISSRGFVRVR